MSEQKTLFVFDKGAAEYIKKRSDAIVVGFKLEPALGGCACSAKRITGSYIPEVSIGAPTDTDRYQIETINGITIYFPKNMKTKPDFEQITVKLRGLSAFGWLELEGARAVSEFN